MRNFREVTLTVQRACLQKTFSLCFPRTRGIRRRWGGCFDNLFGRKFENGIEMRGGRLGGWRLYAERLARTHSTHSFACSETRLTLAAVWSSDKEKARKIKKGSWKLNISAMIDSRYWGYLRVSLVGAKKRRGNVLAKKGALVVYSVSLLSYQRGVTFTTT